MDMFQRLAQDKLFIAICIVIGLVGLVHLLTPKHNPASIVAENGQTINGKNVEVNSAGIKTLEPKTLAADNDDADTAIIQTSDTGCLISNPHAVKQHDGTVLAKFQVSGINATNGKQLQVQVISPNVEPAAPDRALIVEGKAPLILSTESSIQPGAATATMGPAQSTFFIETKLSGSGKIALDCRVM